ncbi:Fmp41 [Kluyveromyces lactis]|nr:Fmp41 [Kluyveromyces lactis]
MSYEYLNRAKKIICIGRNYAAHIKELNNATPKQLFFFLKPTSSLVTPVGPMSKSRLNPEESVTFNGLNEDGSNPGPIYVPKGTIIHHEVELALVVDKHLSNLNKESFGPEQVWDSISGVSLALDLTARNVQDEAKKKGLPWTIGKGFDTFCPISHFIPKEELFNKVNLQDSFRLSCSVNGQLRQHDSTSLMLNPLHTILQHISTMISLEPNDIVLTGTPAGVGELHPGDTIECELYQDDKLLVSFEFDCEQRPGPYEYKEV